MSTPKTKPCFVAGTPRNSGDVQTGEIATTQGGGRVYTSFSGLVGGDALIYTGAGRLNQILVTANLTSGKTVVFYDSAVATSGGPFSASGHKVVGVIGPVWHPGASGVINPYSQPGGALGAGLPFQSGLCAGCIASGTPSFSVSYTPEVND